MGLTLRSPKLPGKLGRRTRRGSGARATDPNPESQVRLMRADVARLLADGSPVEQCDDNLLVELDLSLGNLPAGTRLRIGTALCAVTPKPHTGCSKFAGRFGADAR